jgi:ABC-2 type transport system permease protein
MLSQLFTLYQRRLKLLAGTRRELIVPLATPLLFALIIAPALNDSLGTFNPRINYMTFVAIATVTLLVPLNALFTGISIFTDRERGGLRELLAAPAPRWLVPAGNVLATLTVTALQVAVLILVAVVRGATLHTSIGGVLWFVGAAVLLASTMAAIAEVLVYRTHSPEEYVGLVPAVAIVPWFFAGSLFPISVLPKALEGFAKVLPTTHALALMRFGLVDGSPSGLEAIWGSHSGTCMALGSTAVLAGFTALFIMVATRVFRRSALQ